MFLLSLFQTKITNFINLSLWAVFRPPASCYSPLRLHHLEAKAGCCLDCHVLIYICNYWNISKCRPELFFSSHFSSTLVLLRILSLSSFLLASSSGLLPSLMIASILFQFFMVLVQHRHSKLCLIHFLQV